MYEAIRRRLVVTVLAVSVLLSISGCSNLFTGNLFSSFDGPPSASDLAGRYADEEGRVSRDDADDFVNDVDDAAGSSRFFGGLSEADRAELTDSLNSVYQNPEVDEKTRQRAAVLAADVTLRGADSGDTINNVADVLTSSEGTDDFSDPGQLLDQIIPDNAKDDPEAIQKILDDMVTAADAYDALGTSLRDEDDDGTLDGPEGTNMAEVAQKAAVAMVVRNIVEQDKLQNGDDSTILRDGISSGNFDDTSYEDPLSSEQDKDGDSFDNLLNAGGLDGFFDSET